MKYLVILNWHGEIHRFFTTATTELHAMNNGVYKLAKVLGRDVKAHFMADGVFNNRISYTEMEVTTNGL